MKRSKTEKAADKVRAQVRTLETLYRLMEKDVKEVSACAGVLGTYDHGAFEAAMNLWETAAQIKRQAHSIVLSAEKFDAAKAEEEKKRNEVNRLIHKHLLHFLQGQEWKVVTSEEGKFIEVTKKGVGVFFSVELHNDDACHRYAGTLSIRVKKQDGESIQDYAMRAARFIDDKWKEETGYLEPSLIVSPDNVEVDF